MQWGGPEEQAKERAAGNLNAIDWYDEALKIVEKTMEEYSNKPMPRSTRTLEPSTSTSAAGTSRKTHIVESEYDHHRRVLVENASREYNAGWRAELRRYISDMPDDVSKDTDIIEWWSVSTSYDPA
jgi:hypothetical protein